MVLLKIKVLHWFGCYEKLVFRPNLIPKMQTRTTLITSLTKEKKKF